MSAAATAAGSATVPCGPDPPRIAGKRWTKSDQVDTVPAMKGRRTMWFRHGALLPYPVLLLLLTSCGPPAGSAPLPEAAGEVEEPGSRSAVTMAGRVRMFRGALFREQRRSAQLQAQLDQRTQEIQRLEAEVTRRREHEAQLQADLDRVMPAAAVAPAAPRPIPAALPPSGPTDATQPAPSSTAGAAETRRQRHAQAERAGALAGLRAALADEQAQRKRAETQLARLKEETSTPPYGAEPVTQAALAAARQEVSDLRAELDKERAARERMAEEFRALQERASADRAAAQGVDAGSPQLRARLRELEEEKQNITQSFNRSLAESEQRTAELERQLAVARSAPTANAPSESEISAVRAENDTLRSQLDAEHRRTEELAAKLRIAMRVTDLIFKMQGQQIQPPAGPQR